MLYQPYMLGHMPDWWIMPPGNMLSYMPGHMPAHMLYMPDLMLYMPDLMLYMPIHMLYMRTHMPVYMPDHMLYIPDHMLYMPDLMPVYMLERMLITARTHARIHARTFYTVTSLNTKRSSYSTSVFQNRAKSYRLCTYVVL
jgi:hypothetical protein